MASSVATKPPRPARFKLLQITVLLWAGLALARGEQTATVVTPGPVSFVKGASHVTRPVLANEVFHVVSIAGSQVTVSDTFGFQATLQLRELKMGQVAVASAPATSTPIRVANTEVAPNPPPTPAPSVPSPSAPADATVSATLAESDTVHKLNDAFQLSLFTNTSLWSENVESLAGRLQWPQESKTDMDSSYRRYALEGGCPVLGARAYSLALYGRKGHPTYISIVFANKGDIKAGDEAALDAAVKQDSEAINAKLSEILGPSESHVFGPTADSRETVHRWNYQDQAILFSAPRGEYAAIKIMPTTVADHFGSVENLDRDALRDQLATRVLKRDNGDIVIQQIPMVDQGPKGYCVPATWERYLRYVDVPADMYVLAMLGGTGSGGGTNVDAIRAGLNDYVESYGRRIEDTNGRLEMSGIGKFIDKGLPLMWSCFVQKAVEKAVNERQSQRKSTTDWEAYKTALAEFDKTLSFYDPERQHHGHMRMIIGYNSQTDELAISDSWGQHFTERWISLKEAQETSQGQLEYIQW